MASEGVFLTMRAVDIRSLCGLLLPLVMLLSSVSSLADDSQRPPSGGVAATVTGSEPDCCPHRSTHHKGIHQAGTPPPLSLSLFLSSWLRHRPDCPSPGSCSTSQRPPNQNRSALSKKFKQQQQQQQKSPWRHRHDGK